MLGKRALSRLAILRTQKGYGRAATVAKYMRDERLHGCETRAFAQCGEEISDGVIDLGCGAGRTTVPLLPLTSSYLGVDYTSSMIDACRTRFAAATNARFLVADAADLRTVPDGRAGFVLFSYNGIDNVGHAHRLRILREAKRVLRPGGIFAFSHHNLNASEIVRRPRIPTKFTLSTVRQFVGALRNSLVNRWFEERGPDYEVINDSADGFSLLVYYCSIAAQRRQLASAGFELVACTDMLGVEVDPESTRAPFVFHLARKR